MDCIDDDQHVGVWKNSIFAKVTRIDMNEYDNDDDAEFISHHNTNGYTPTTSSSVQQSAQPSRSNATPARSHPISTTQKDQQPVTSQNPEPLLGFDDPSPASLPSSVSTSENNLLDVGIESSGGNPTQGPEGSLLDMTAPSSNHSIGSSGHTASDFLGMTTTTTSQPPQAKRQPTYQPSKPPPPAPSGNGTALNNAFRGPFGDLEWK